MSDTTEIAVLPRVSRRTHRAVTAALVAVGVSLSAAGVWLAGEHLAERRKSTPPAAVVVPRVRALRLARRLVPLRAEATGFLRSPATVRVPVETSGKLLRKHKAEGDPVAAGELLAEMDGELLRLRIEAAEAREKSQRAQLEYVDGELAREEELARRGAGRPADRDRWLSEKRRIDAALLENTAVLAEWRLLLEKCRVVADRGGVWYEDLAREGEYLTAGQTLGLLREVAPLELEVEVPGHVRLALAVGQAVEVEILDADPTLSAVPRHVEGCKLKTLPAGSDESSRRFPVVVEVPNDDGALLPGLFARARWTLPRQDPLLLVPKECVFERYGKRALYVVEDGADGERRAQVRFIGVRSLADEPGSWLVSEGVEDGEFVVVSPIEELSPGSQVELEGGV